MSSVLHKSELPGLKLFKRGKVRDVYDLGDALLVVSTDRISCFDVVLPTGIPDKGRVLNSISVFWFELLKDVIPNHIITADVSAYPARLRDYSAMLQGRSMIVSKAQALPVECVVRGYLAGSGWNEYRKKRSVCGIPLPEGLQEASKLPQALFTPSTKAEEGHDQNISIKEVEKQLGGDIAGRLRQVSLDLYTRAADYALKKGIIIADTKFEFGMFADKLILIDEVLTPDSSRFWPLDRYKPGVAQPSFDKQFVRDYLEGLTWGKTPPAPPLPDEIVASTRLKYLEAYRKLTGRELGE